jgi:hypothetical protein
MNCVTEDFCSTFHVVDLLAFEENSVKSWANKRPKWFLQDFCNISALPLRPSEKVTEKPIQAS